MTARPRRWLLGALLLLVLAGVVVYYYRTRPVPPVPPGEDLAGLEPAVREAVDSARRGVLAEPRSADAWGKLGETLLANELDTLSARCFAEAERLDPEEGRWPYYQGGTLINQGESNAALPYLRRAVERCDTTLTAPLHLLGETLMSLGHLDEAEAQFREALRRKPDEPRARYNLGLVAVARQDWQVARDAFSACLADPACRQKARFQLAAVLARLNEPAKANEFLDQTRRMPKDLEWPDPLVAEYLQRAVKKRERYRRVEQLEAAGRYRDAVAVLVPMTEQFPDDALPHLTLGKMLGQTGDYARAEVALRKAMRLDPDTVQPLYFTSLVLYLQGEALAKDKRTEERAQACFREAAELARNALRLQPDYGFAHMSLGLALKRQGRPAEAIDALRKAVRCNPELAEIHYYLGETLAEQGHGAEARTQLDAALRLAEPHVAWRKAAEERLGKLP